MRFNENIAILAPKVLLVPYDRHHVPRYHEWMEDPAIREATASDRLTLEEEYENQMSWREAPDKLTFILCQPLPQDGDEESASQGQAAPTRVIAGEADRPDRMVGDVNLFLTPWDPDEDGGEEEKEEEGKTYVRAEVDIMIANPAHRGRGLGRAVLVEFLAFVRGHLDGILAEYNNAGSPDAPRLREVVAKIGADNGRSVALFRGLGFRQRGGVNYFGEVEVVLREEGKESMVPVAAGRIGAYDRSRLRE
ncbi:GNAT domain-containing protein [Hypoxylon sp. FL1284]|nr:GNAT domain-containing protein [Hypoxylon sp. FL1284]